MKGINIRKDMNELIVSLKKLIDREIWRNTFFFSVIAGLVVHLVILTNYIANHDSMCMVSNDGGWLLVQGKWFVTPVSSLEGPLDIFFLSGTIGIVAVSVAAVIFCINFRIYNVWKCRLIGLCFVSFPSIATMALYHAVDCFGITFLLAIVAGYFLCQKGIFNNLIGIVLLVFSLGAYQAYVGATLVILVLECLIKVLNGDKFERVLFRGIQFVIEVILSIGLYYVVLKIMLFVKKVELSGYKGIDNMTGNLRPDILINSVIVALSNVKDYLISDSLGIYGKKFAFFNVVLIILLLVIEIVLVKRNKLKCKEVLLMFFLTWVCLPLGANIIGVLSANTSFYYITIAPFVLLFLVPLVVTEQLDLNVNGIINKGITLIIMCISLMLSMNWTIQNNTVYQKLLFVHQEYDAKLTMLANQIQENENYTDEVEIVIVGTAPFEFLKSSGVLRWIEDEFVTKGYGLGNSEEMVYSEAILYTFLHNKYAITFNVIKYDESIGIPIDEVQEMKVYPNYGSIRSYDDKIIVKLSDN